MGAVCAKILRCEMCGQVLANYSGTVALISYAHRTMFVTGLMAARCECGHQVTLEKGFVLPENWKPAATRVDCPTPGCRAPLGWRVGDVTMVAYQNRVYVYGSLLYLACNECGREYERGKGL